MDGTSPLLSLGFAGSGPSPSVDVELADVLFEAESADLRVPGVELRFAAQVRLRVVVMDASRSKSDTLEGGPRNVGDHSSKIWIRVCGI